MRPERSRAEHEASIPCYRLALMSNPTVPHLLSTKPIPSAERLIFALDVATPEEARRLAETDIEQ